MEVNHREAGRLVCDGPERGEHRVGTSRKQATAQAQDTISGDDTAACRTTAEDNQTGLQSLAVDIANPNKSVTFRRRCQDNSAFKGTSG
jgi:hypothetical protein